jgi:5'-methylthioadenosine phosphorylase
LKVGIIGGSGLYHIDGLTFVDKVEVNTKYGKPSDSYKIYKKGILEYYFLARHGEKHNIAPHKINYRANIAGFKELGVKKIISFCAVGSLDIKYPPSTIIIPDNAIDFTNGRAATYFDEERVFHVDVTDPFCGILRNMLIDILHKNGISFCEKGVYVCTNGPRLETAAEVKMFRYLGGDVVGMTLFPELTLAREAEICYANMCIVTNFGAGISKNKLTTAEVKENMKKNSIIVNNIVYGLADELKNIDKCDVCTQALKFTKA